MSTYKPYFFSLHSYLALADNHYVEGRFLWLNQAFNGAGNLLWLAFEQLIKILIIQNMIEKNSLHDIEIKGCSGKKIKVKYDQNENDLELMAKILDSLFFGIDSKHNLNSLLRSLKDDTGIDLTEYNKCLTKINEFFKRRYVVNSGTSINPVMLDEIDRLFFYLRCFISHDIPQSFIDEIIFKRKYTIQEPIPFFGTLFHKNNYVVPRQYNDIIDRIPDGRVVAHNGIKFKEFPKEAHEYLFRKGYPIQLRWTYLRMKDQK